VKQPQLFDDPKKNKFFEEFMTTMGRFMLDYIEKNWDDMEAECIICKETIEKHMFLEVEDVCKCTKKECDG
jgi:hypothetical protein